MPCNEEPDNHGDLLVTSASGGDDGGLQRRGDAYGCSTRCATSLTIRSNAPLATVYFYSSRRDLLEIQSAASVFGWRVATHYPMLLGSRMRDEAGALNVAGSDVFG